MKIKSFFLLVFMTVGLMNAVPQARIIESVWGRQTPSDTRTEEERQIIFHTDMGDSILHKSLNSDHEYANRAGVKTVLAKISEGQTISKTIKQSLLALSKKQVSYDLEGNLKVALILSGDTDKTTQAKQLADYFNSNNFLLKKMSIFYAGKMGHDSILSELSTKLSDHDMGMADRDRPPYEGAFHYAQAAIDQINALHQPKNKQVEYLLHSYLAEEPTVAREEVLVDIGQDAIPVLISKLATSFEEGTIYDIHSLRIADIILREMNISDTKATKALIPYLSNKSGPLRDLCVRALAGIGTEEAIPYLEKVTPVDKWLQKDMPDIIEGIRTRASMEKKISNW